MHTLCLTPARPSAAIVHHWAVLCAAAATWLAGIAAASAQAPAPDDRATSAGRWAVVAVEWDGKPVAAEFLEPLQVSYQADGSWAVLFKNRPIVEGRSTNRQDDSPKTFEMETLGSEGIPPSRSKGIYRVAGDTRVLCIVPAGKPLPVDFSAPRRSGRMLVTLARPAP
jgi:uncharacterized protein (TIGR03067 family)